MVTNLWTIQYYTYHRNKNFIRLKLYWPYIPDYPYRILIIGSSVSERTNALLNLIKIQQPDIDKSYLHFKDPFESKYQLLINGREKVGIKYLKNSKTFIDYSQTFHDIYEDLEDNNPTKKRRVLIVFDDITPDMESNKTLSPSVIELLLRGRKLTISLVFISKSYFKVPKTIRLNATHYFIMKIPNKRELQQIASNHSSEIDFKDFMKLYKNYTKEPYSFLVNDTALSSDNPLRCRNNLL